MKYQVEFVIEVPDNVSYDDLLEWVKFKLHASGQIMNDNPLYDKEIEPLSFPPLRVEKY